MKVKKGIDGKLDIAWALLVKHRAGFKCFHFSFQFLLLIFRFL